MLKFKLKPLRKQFQRAGKSARLRAQCVIGGMLRAGASCIALRRNGRMSKNGECPALPANPLPQPRAVTGRRRMELLMQPDQISAQRLCQGQEQRAQLRGMISVKWFERLDQRVSSIFQRLALRSDALAV